MSKMTFRIVLEHFDKAFRVSPLNLKKAKAEKTFFKSSLKIFKTPNYTLTRLLAILLNFQTFVSSVYMLLKKTLSQILKLCFYMIF